MNGRLAECATIVSRLLLKGRETRPEFGGIRYTPAVCGSGQPGLSDNDSRRAYEPAHEGMHDLISILWWRFVMPYGVLFAVCAGGGGGYCSLWAVCFPFRSLSCLLRLQFQPPKESLTGYM